MFRLLVEKELRDIIGTTKFAVTFGVCSVLVLLAFYVGARNYEVSREEYEGAIAENVKQMEGLTDWGQVSHRIFLPPQPLATLVSGISNDVGRTTEMETSGELHLENSRFNEDPIYAVFRFLDLEFIFGIVLSLFAILFSYDAINGEKERGTLRLSFANSVPRDRYILSKLVGAFVSLGVPLLIPILIGAVLLPVLGVPMTAGAWGRLGLVVLSGYLYLGVFLTLSVFVSALTERSSSSFLLLLVVWIFAVLIIPRAAVLVAGRAVDVPSVDQVNFEKNRFTAQLIQEERPKISEFVQRGFAQRGVGGQTDMMQWMEDFQDFMNDLADVREEKFDEFARQLNEDRQNRDMTRQSLALGIARLSPTSVFSLATSNLAGTSLALKARYLESANRYRDSYAQFIERETGNRSGMRFTFRMGQEQEEPDPIDPYELPVFEYEGPLTRDLIGGSMIDLGLLALFNVIFFTGAFVAFLRYDVR